MTEEEKESVKSVLKLVDLQIEKVKELDVDIKNKLKEMDNIDIKLSQ